MELKFNESNELCKVEMIESYTPLSDEERDLAKVKYEQLKEDYQDLSEKEKEFLEESEHKKIEIEQQLIKYNGVFDVEVVAEEVTDNQEQQY